MESTVIANAIVQVEFGVEFDVQTGCRQSQSQSQSRESCLAKEFALVVRLRLT